MLSLKKKEVIAEKKCSIEEHNKKKERKVRLQWMCSIKPGQWWKEREMRERTKKKKNGVYKMCKPAMIRDIY